MSQNKSKLSSRTGRSRGGNRENLADKQTIEKEINNDATLKFDEYTATMKLDKLYEMEQELLKEDRTQKSNRRGL